MTVAITEAFRSETGQLLARNTFTITEDYSDYVDDMRTSSLSWIETAPGRAFYREYTTKDSKLVGVVQLITDKG